MSSCAEPKYGEEKGYVRRPSFPGTQMGSIWSGCCEVESRKYRIAPRGRDGCCRSARRQQWLSAVLVNQNIWGCKCTIASYVRQHPQHSIFPCFSHTKLKANLCPLSTTTDNPLIWTCLDLINIFCCTSYGVSSSLPPFHNVAPFHVVSTHQLSKPEATEKS